MIDYGAGWFVTDGHRIEIQKWFGQGGELEDLVAWCHVCDYTGSNLMKVDMLDGTSVPEGLVKLNQLMKEHLNGR